ncbi:uncharacterized protein BJX67DRAFT_360590 [Aspergillus lucknowensis]|uniref:F-box domain-containing protein n=1 Tax=Aspergillus lucknowensis TaxID=176173 RepID=A0ABR4LJI1_9EURO
MVADFNVYCALCSCCLNNCCDTGSASPRHLTIRRARVARRTYSRRIGELYYETDDESEEEKANRLESLPWLREAAEADDGLDTLSVADDKDDHTYDPHVVTGWNLDWLGDIVAVGIENRGSGPRVYFLTKCWYDDRNVVYTTHDYNLDYSEEESRYFAYGVSDLPDPPIFPMHQACLEVLSRAIFGRVDVDRVQKNILYEVMHELSDFCRLDLDYGDITGADQDWQCVPGEEYSVICPTDPIDLAEQLRTDYSISPPKAQTRLDLSDKVIRDPFRNLPYDITYHILQYLPGESILALNKASGAIFMRTSNDSFWKRRLSQDMPWLWELQNYLAKHQDEALDYKALYMWLNKRTKPMYAMDGPFMGAANRRRIWGACVELAHQYHKRLRASDNGVGALN